MPKNVRRRLAAASLVLLLPTLGACGFGAQTNKVYQPAVGANARGASVDVLGAVVVSEDEGSGTFVASLVNTSLDQDDELTGITGEDVQVQLTAPVELRADDLLNLADSGAAAVEGEGIRAGSYTRLTLEFGSGQQTEINVPVVAPEEEFADVTPAEPSSSTSSSPGSSPSASPSESASPSAGESASGSASPSESPSP
ncbi:hypothetical protein ASG49_10240 [Marmoricola sp. Leaf446]|uniref:hypothetical protein n=1 Tax=Marmoricola sp. Leaf446 TaxID=1736379 RepID=UPI0006FF420E|nr:hypothetical protein [Marmoricola sp. Leaf446]KQT92295.1 hypothetical protein ASG49_10240 [Marmoricola sp. Leaf446]